MFLVVQVIIRRSLAIVALTLPSFRSNRKRLKLERADALPNRPRGKKIRRSTRTISVNVRPDDPTVFVGVDCASDHCSYVNLSTMGAGIVKIGPGRALAPELEAVDLEEQARLADAALDSHHKQARSVAGILPGEPASREGGNRRANASQPLKIH
jgi:hypothetical protein